MKHITIKQMYWGRTVLNINTDQIGTSKVGIEGCQNKIHILKSKGLNRNVGTFFSLKLKVLDFYNTINYIVCIKKRGYYE